MKKFSKMTDLHELFLLEKNELLFDNFQDFDLGSLISEVNQPDSQNFPTSSESSLLPLNFDQENTQNNSCNKYRKIFPSSGNNDNTVADIIIKTDFVRYGRGWIKKDSDEYRDMRKRNNEAIHKCRRFRGGESNKLNKLTKTIQENHCIIKECIKEIKFSKGFSDNIDTHEKSRRNHDSQCNHLKN